MRLRYLPLMFTLMFPLSGCDKKIPEVPKTPASAVPVTELTMQQKFAVADNKAKSGDAVGQYNLGEIYAKGEGVPRDLAKAVEWWQKSAAQGNEAAQSRLGVSYGNGEGVSKDPVRAYAWSNLAANQGDGEAKKTLEMVKPKLTPEQKIEAEHLASNWKKGDILVPVGDAIGEYNQGEIYSKGEGIPKDSVKAVEFWQKSAAQGNEAAQAELGLSYGNGEGVSKDPVRAYAWSNLAANQGNTEAKKNLQIIKEKLTPVQKVEAEHLVSSWKKGDIMVSAGDVVGQYNQGEIYAKGEGIPQNPAKAVEFWQKSAAQGHDAAQSELGLSHEKGEGANKDPILAYAWSNLAANQGHAEAKKNLEIIKEQLTPVQKIEAEYLVANWKKGEILKSPPIAVQVELSGNGVPASNVQVAAAIPETPAVSSVQGNTHASKPSVVVPGHLKVHGSEVLPVRPRSGVVPPPKKIVVNLDEGVEPDVDRTQSVFKCSYCPEMVEMPEGSFDMGSPRSEPGRYKDEGPVHAVTVKAFALGKTEVTQGQWRAVMGKRLGTYSNCGDHCPIGNVSWDDAKVYIQKLNAKTGLEYRLPSEAEWEYACRAGGKQAYCGSENLDSVAWYENNSESKEHPVSQKLANGFGLYDMSGNMWEWVGDSYHNSYKDAPEDGSAWLGDSTKRVLRGGSWNHEPRLARAANRGFDGPTGRRESFGLRLAKSLP